MIKVRLKQLKEEIENGQNVKDITDFDRCQVLELFEIESKLRPVCYAEDYDKRTVGLLFVGGNSGTEYIVTKRSDSFFYITHPNAD